ncbi:MAG: hypothetical protein OEZ24_01150 [Candidatus Bathyarchaeota archaeon]|nr:hypothetical protein [Candidatus Bathyarchaeota archaeon]
MLKKVALPWETERLSSGNMLANCILLRKRLCWAAEASRVLRIEDSRWRPTVVSVDTCSRILAEILSDLVQRDEGLVERLEPRQDAGLLVGWASL